MTIKAILWTYGKRSDGSCDIKIYCYPPKKYHTTGINVQPKHWDKAKGRVKKTHPSHQILNARIEGMVNKYTQQAHTPPKSETCLVAFLELFIQEAEDGLHPLKPGTVRKYRSTLTRLQQYQQMTNKTTVPLVVCDLQWHAEFCRWLAKYGDCTAPGLTKHTKVLKRVLKVARSRELHQSRAYEDFPTTNKQPKKIYLREEEIQAIQDLDLSDFPHLDRERDRFLVSYYLPMRFGDSQRIERANAYQENGRWYYRYVSEKTEVPVIVPIKPVALEILIKNNWQLHNDYNSESNRHIKTIAAMASINEPVTEGGRTAPKWRFVTTHTARRSAATNMALAGVQIEIIAKVGGWTRIAQLRTYLQASGVDIARVAADLEFFK